MAVFSYNERVAYRERDKLHRQEGSYYKIIINKFIRRFEIHFFVICYFCRVYRPSLPFCFWFGKGRLTEAKYKQRQEP